MSQHRRARWSALLLSLMFLAGGRAGWAASPDEPPPARSSWVRRLSNVRLISKTHTVVATNDLSGPGSNVPNLANTYDMSLFEWNWGGKQSTFNGAGITTNANYPLTEGEAITTNAHLGLAVDLAKGVEAGFLWQLYASGGNRTVGRVYGEELPWDNFERRDGRVVQERFATDFHQAWIKDTDGDLTYQVMGGNLKDLDLTRKEFNFLKLGSLIYRPPVTNASFFEKEDRKLESGRHPLRGADAVIDFPYLQDKHLHGEIFLGRTKPTPVQEIDRDVVGTRWGLDILEGNLGVSYVATEGERNPSITGERQALWALDGSYPLVKWLALYGAWAHSAYHRSGQLNGNAWVGGLRLLGPAKSEWRTQYQWLGENYELMGHHKTEHYPTNFHGVQTTLTIPVLDGTVKGILYRLHQIETNTHEGDTIFGDSYFPALADSKRGDITVARLGGDYDLGKHHDGLPKLSAYLEQAVFQKDAPDTADNDIDKAVANWNLLVSQPVIKHLNIELGYRLVTASGRWQAMRFHHRQGIPEVALTYRVKEKDKDRFRATVLYHYYDFVDSIAASSGNNDYQAHQMIVEVYGTF
ncbi:MAG: hypothetical protein HY596_03605 [Candidatus Omnitrophica bacterium]|nr:hypothetical protein [Candidatus Omnitrophota bacterium]